MEKATGKSGDKEAFMLWPALSVLANIASVISMNASNLLNS